MEDNTEIMRLPNETKSIVESIGRLREESEAMNNGIEFLTNEWNTNKRYFRDKPGHATTKDLIRAVFNFAWGSKRNFDRMHGWELADKSVGEGYLQNWYQDSIDATKEPVWTDRHIEELVKDFYVIPKN